MKEPVSNSDEIERVVRRVMDAVGTRSDPSASGLTGDPLDELYKDLHSLAEGLMRNERGGHTLQATALVHEAYLRLAGSENLVGADRLRFLDAAAVTMRRVLVDHARTMGAEKRGGAWERVTLQGVSLGADEEDELDVLRLQEALGSFEEVDPRAAKVVELRFFGGMSGDEIAQHLGVSRNTVVRELTHARAWLARRLDASAE